MELTQVHPPRRLRSSAWYDGDVRDAHRPRGGTEGPDGAGDIVAVPRDTVPLRTEDEQERRRGDHPAWLSARGGEVKPPRSDA